MKQYFVALLNSEHWPPEPADVVKVRVTMEKKLASFAKTGWRVVTVTIDAAGYYLAFLEKDAEEETSTISEAGSPWPSGPYKPEARDAKETPEEKPRLLGTFMGYQIYTDPRMDDETLRIMKRRLTLEVRPPGYEKKS